jgi:type I restriction enzyme, S subunit
VGKYQGYEKYKDSGVEWLGAIPEHWEAKRLKNLTSCNDEALGENTSPDYEIEYVDISSVDLISGITHYESMTFDKSPSRARRKVRDGDTIISTVRTYLKSIAAIKEPPTNLIVSTGFAVVRPKDKINSDYIGYLLQTEGFIGDVVSNSVGVSYPAINSTVLISLPVVEPPLDEQESIAYFLDRKTTQIDALIAKKEALIEKLDEKRTALISHAVTKGLDSSVPMKDSGVEWLGDIPEHWDVSRIGFIANIGNGSTPNRSNVSFWDQGSIPWLNSSKVNEKIIYSASQFVTEDAVKQCHLPIVQPDSIVLAITGEGKTRGNVAICKIHTTINQHLAYISLSTTKVSLHFLFLYLQAMYEKIRTDSAGNGSTKGAITCQEIKGYKLPLPTIKEQEKIVNFLDVKIVRIDQQKAKVKEAIELLKEYRTALITNAVTGKIDVRQVASV